MPEATDNAPDDLKVVVEDGGIAMKDFSQPPNLSAATVVGSQLPPRPRRFSISMPKRLSILGPRLLNDERTMIGPAPVKVGKMAAEGEGFFQSWSATTVELMPDGSLVLSGRKRKVVAEPSFKVRFTVDEGLPIDSPTFECYRRLDEHTELQFVHLLADSEEERTQWIEAILHQQDEQEPVSAEPMGIAQV